MNRSRHRRADLQAPQAWLRISQFAGCFDVQPDATTISVVAGETFFYTSYANDHAPLPTVTVTAFDAATAENLGTTTSDGGGLYSVPIATGATPRPLRVVYARTGYFATTVHLDQPLDRDVNGASVNLWELGDAPLWDITAMTAIYDTVSLRMQSLPPDRIATGRP